MSHRGVGFEAEKWKDVSRIYRRLMGLALGRKPGRAEVKARVPVTKNTEEMLASKDNETVLPDLAMAGMLRQREVFHRRSGDRQQGVCERNL